MDFKTYLQTANTYFAQFRIIQYKTFIFECTYYYLANMYQNIFRTPPLMDFLDPPLSVIVYVLYLVVILNW